MTDTPQLRADDDAERLAQIDERLAYYKRARDRGFSHAGPGKDEFTYEDMALVRRLLDSRDAALHEARRAGIERAAQIIKEAPITGKHIMARAGKEDLRIWLWERVRALLPPAAPETK